MHELQSGTGDGCYGLPHGTALSQVNYACPARVFCDPQLGCSDRLVAQDLSDEHAWQFSQEFRLASNFSGPFNFSVGGNYLHYETEENYYVFINTLTAWPPMPGAHQDAATFSKPGHGYPGVSDNANCLIGGLVEFKSQFAQSFGAEGRQPASISIPIRSAA